jgi:hypothetical protein
MSKSKSIGTRCESAVVKVAQASGFPYAKRLALSGSADEGDVQLDSRGQVIVEVKGGKAAESASDSLIEKWLLDTERERVNAGANRAFLVVKRAGKGDRNAGQWWAVCGLPALADLYGLQRYPLEANLGVTVRMKLDDMLALHRDVFGEEA